MIVVLDRLFFSINELNACNSYLDDGNPMLHMTEREPSQVMVII